VDYNPKWSLNEKINFSGEREELREADINLLINVIRRKHMISMDTAEHTDNSIQKMLDLIEHFESNASSPVESPLRQHLVKVLTTTPTDGGVRQREHEFFEELPDIIKRPHEVHGGVVYLQER
jgi:hypothetical protein